jgi:hypothetical protein
VIIEARALVTQDIIRPSDDIFTDSIDMELTHDKHDAAEYSKSSSI